MTYGGYGNGPPDPFDGDPFGGSPSGGTGYGSGPHGYGPQGPGYPGATPGYPGGGLDTARQPPQGEVNTLSTLSIVFAVVFAPVGAVLGHLALRQIRDRGQRGRERAIIGLTLSYIVIVAAIVALVIWLLSGNGSDATPAATSTTPTTTTIATAEPPPPPITTVITAPPTTRPTVQVEELSIGDCVEFKQTEPIPGEPEKDYTVIYRSPCVARDGVFQVIAMVESEHECHTRYLFNASRTLFACLTDFRG
jgi:hypothetical protein